MKKSLLALDKIAFRNIIFVSALVVAGLYSATSFYFQGKFERERVQKNQLISFSNLGGSIVEADIESPDGHFVLPFKDNKILMTDEMEGHISLPYKIQARVTMTNKETRNIQLSLSASGVDYYVMLNGFLPEDTVSLSLNDSTSVVRMPFDWSGNTKLGVLVNPNFNSKVCVTLHTKEPFGFCHVLTGKLQGAA